MSCEICKHFEICEEGECIPLVELKAMRAVVDAAVEVDKMDITMDSDGFLTDKCWANLEALGEAVAAYRKEVGE